MKICYLCSDLGIPVGGRKGAAAHVRGLVNAFTELGHEVELLTTRPDGDQGCEARVVPIPVSGLASTLGSEVPKKLGRALGHVWNNVAVEVALESHLTRFQPDLVYERYSPFGVAGGLVAARHDIPHVLEVNAPLAWEGQRYRQQALSDVAEELEHSAFASAGSIVAVSRVLADTLEDIGAAPEKITVVPNGVDTSRFTPAGPTARGFAEQFVIGFVGSLKPWHGIDVLIEAFRDVAEDPRMHLLVVGEGPEAGKVDALAEELPGRVTRGAVDHDEVPSYLRAMDVAVAPYPAGDHFYFSPLKILEYLATGCVVVASDIGQVSELVQDELTGLLVPAGDTSALKRAVRGVAADSELAAQLSANAQESAHREHSWVQRAHSILETVGLPPVGAGRGRHDSFGRPIGRSVPNRTAPGRAGARRSGRKATAHG